MGDCWRIVEDVSIWSGVTDEKRRGTRDGAVWSPCRRILSVVHRRDNAEDAAPASMTRFRVRVGH